MNSIMLSGQKPRILVVENELIVSADIAARLTRLGYEVCGEADCSEDAIQYVAIKKPDLVLMDIRLQGEVDGIATAEQIRERFKVPIVYLTAHTDEATLQRAKITGPFGYILKPFEERELRTAIEIGLYKFHMEKRLADSEQYLASTLANIGDAVIATDSHGCVTLLNKAAQQLTGWQIEDARGKSLFEVFCVKSHHKVLQQGLLQSILSTGLLVSSIDPLLLTSRTGEIFEVQVNATPILEIGASSRGAVVVFRDVTAFRRQDEELRLAQRMDALGRLASGISHDFNNLLTILLAQSNALIGQLAIDSPQYEIAKDIADTSRRASELTQQLLAFGRKRPLHLHPLDLSQVTQNACKLLRRVIPKNIELSVNLWPSPCVILADHAMLEQVIINLVLNAKDAMPNGGNLRVETSIVSHPPCSAEGAIVNRPLTKLVVTDSGIGMDEVTQLRVWEPFFSTKSNGKGTGLGLANVYSAVQQFGGHVSVKSQLGHGAEFQIYFPMTTTVYENNECLPSPPMAKSSETKETILVVEDDVQVRNILEQILTSAGYQVLVAADGVDAIEMTSSMSQRIDLLLTDVLMPRMDGPTLAAEVSTQRPEVVTVFLTGYSGKDGLENELPNGKKPHCVEKPFAPPALLSFIKRVLQEAKQVAM